jgi:hypothetical protein
MRIVGIKRILKKALAILIEQVIFALLFLWMFKMVPGRATTIQITVVIVTFSSAVLASGLLGYFIERRYGEDVNNRYAEIIEKYASSALCFEIAFFAMSIPMPISARWVATSGLGYAMIHLLLAKGIEFMLSLNKKKIQEIIEEMFEEEEL